MYFAITLNRLNDFDNACLAFDKALQLEQNDCAIYLNYAIVLFNNGYTDRCRKLFDQAEKIFAEMDEEDKEPEMLDQRQVLMEALGIN
mmetsp:Transcript_24067/g.23696  ORF Transcript_24067/g.23696 Transcript_24067/m.23696 type:complete len:88 (+) Transcript_24067:1011-1274(+)